jgi:hypothetical protein
MMPMKEFNSADIAHHIRNISLFLSLTSISGFKQIFGSIVFLQALSCRIEEGSRTSILQKRYNIGAFSSLIALICTYEITFFAPSIY